MLFLMFCFVLLSAKSQYYPSYGKVEIIKNTKIDELVEKHKQLNKTKKTEGYRIHLFFDSGNNSRNKAYYIKNSFQEKYPEVNVYVTYSEPNFMVRAGNFRTRLQAERFLQSAKKTFPLATIRRVKNIDSKSLGSYFRELEE